MTYGSGNAIYFVGSPDAGKTWTRPILVSESGIVSLGMRRGPRVAISQGAIPGSRSSASIVLRRQGALVTSAFRKPYVRMTF